MYKAMEVTISQWEINANSVVDHRGLFMRKDIFFQKGI